MATSQLLYFSRIILTQITENIKNVDIDIYTEIAGGIFLNNSPE